MSTYYVDPAAGGDNNGTSWANAWTNFQSAADTAVAGDIVYCRGTQTVTSGNEIDLDTNAGNTINGFISFLGCDAGGDAGAGQFILDANSDGANCLKFTSTASYLRFENFTVKNATGDGVLRNGSQPKGWLVKECIFESCGGDGFGDYLSEGMFIKCKFRNNTGHGIGNACSNSRFWGCQFTGNGGNGINNANYSGVAAMGCIFHDNALEQVHMAVAGTLINCVVDGEDDGTSGDGIYNLGSTNLVLGCRITHNDKGGEFGIVVSSAQSLSYEDWNAFYDNDTNKDTGMVHGGNDDETLTDDGYTNRGTDDFNIASGKEIRSEAVNLDWDA